MSNFKFSAVAMCSAGLVVLAILIAGSPARVVGDDGEPGRESRIRRGFASAPLPLNLAGRNRGLVGLGSYFVNVAVDCNVCHTTSSFSPYLANGDPFQGQPEKIDPAKYLVGGATIGGFVSRNLRPETNGLPAGRTYTEFLQIMRTGIDLDRATPLLQVMPWPSFRHLTDEDIRAIYEYLSALPPQP